MCTDLPIHKSNNSQAAASSGCSRGINGEDEDKLRFRPIVLGLPHSDEPGDNASASEGVLSCATMSGVS